MDVFTARLRGQVPRVAADRMAADLTITTQSINLPRESAGVLLTAQSGD